VKRVVVIDDDGEVGLAVRALLAADGYDVATSQSPRTALADLLRDAPDLVILDVNMPGMNGWELCAILRRQTTTRELPVLFLTGRGDIKDRILAMQFGGSGFLSKPFAADDLREKVRALISARENG
jgi:DNA-binding response OmpR family regulator